MPRGGLTMPVGGPYGLSAVTDTQFVTFFVNQSGGTVAVGDLVTFKIDTGVTCTQLTTSTTLQDVNVVGPVAEPASPGRDPGTATSGLTYAAGVVTPVITYGHARMQIGANTVAAGGNLSTTTTAKQAGTAAALGSVTLLQASIGSYIAIAEEAQSAKDANNTIRVFVNKM